MNATKARRANVAFGATMAFVFLCFGAIITDSFAGAKVIARLINTPEQIARGEAAMADAEFIHAIRLWTPTCADPEKWAKLSAEDQERWHHHFQTTVWTPEWNNHKRETFGYELMSGTTNCYLAKPLPEKKAS